jgi:2-C-methyl-D-erythritol 4-phosphate cytidylyltransferase
MQKFIHRYWAIIPAAGIGKRMGGETPKQYLTLHGQPILMHALDTLLSHPLIEAVVVVVSADDVYWPVIAKEMAEKQRVITTHGGQERYHSVLNGLAALSDQATAHDWVLVHDAARPCLLRQDLDRLIEEVSHHSVGGLLGCPVRDTLKRTDTNGEVVETLDRSRTWQAQTPQMFRYGALKEALLHAIEKGRAITDEASAFELMGKAPLMIAGHPSNIKITYPEDIAWVARYWARSLLR